MKRYIIFGAGELGRCAMNYYGVESIEYFIDNNQALWHSRIESIEVIGLEEYLRKDMKKQIIICAAWNNACDIAEQLKEKEIYDYEVFTPQLYEDYDLMINDYEEFEGTTEKVWNQKLKEDKNNVQVRKYVESVKNRVPLFHEIEIETINRCNGVCSFCPVNAKIDPREKSIMSRELFEKIILELEAMSYAGRIALFSNNEPLLDKRFLEFSKFTREHLPKAKIHVFTNGTLLTLQLFQQLIEYLDELIIDNYEQNLQLIPTVKIIKDYIESEGTPELRKKVKILLRKPNEILSSRGGDAPNRTEIMDVSGETCALPFSQLIVRPTGEVSLCCNDPLGKMTMGDLKKETLLEVWYGEKYNHLRKQLVKGRGEVGKCRCCDTFMMI